MALDSELLDRFERDWNDALAHYEARTTASRLGNVQYDPASMTFAPQEQDPKVAAGIQNELFGPLQAKWGLLSEAGRGRSSAAAPQSSMEWSSPMNLGGGEVARFNRLTGEREILNALRPDAPKPTLADKEAQFIRQRQFVSTLGGIDREMSEQRKLLMDAEKLPEKERLDAKSIIMGRLSALSRKRNAFLASAEPKPPEASNALDSSMFATRPDQMMRPIPAQQIFMGDPMAPAIQDPPPAPLPAGPSAKRAIRVLEILREGQ